MAIASTTATPPVFFLLDYLLASSWAWFALILATIATTLRALRLRFPASTTASSSLPDASKFRPCIAAGASASSSGASLQRSFKRRVGSKSTSALENLPHGNGGRFWESGIELLSCVLDVGFPPNLKRIASASEVFHGQHACAEMRERPGPRGTNDRLMHASQEKMGMHSVKQVLSPCKASGFAPDLKFQRKSLPEENGSTTCRRFSMQDQACAEDCATWLPSWAQSLCFPSQLRWPSQAHAWDHVSPLHVASPRFEKQFGWDKMLDSKLGFPWTFASGNVPDCSLERSNVVRMWDDVPKKLLKKVGIDEGSTLALDTCLPEGIACTGDIAGKVSLWDLECRACLRTSAAFAHPVLALSKNDEQCTTVVGSVSSIGLWDHRSPSRSLNFMNVPPAAVSSLKSRVSEICVATDNGILSMYDLRKLSGGPMVWGVAPERSPNLPTSDYESTFWEKFAGVLEEDDEVDCDLSMDAQAAEPKTCGSMMSKLTTFVRAVTFTL